MNTIEKPIAVNCTIVELKHGVLTYLKAENQPVNCTIVELKPI